MYMYIYIYIYIYIRICIYVCIYIGQCHYSVLTRDSFIHDVTRESAFVWQKRPEFQQVMTHDS